MATTAELVISLSRTVAATSGEPGSLAVPPGRLGLRGSFRTSRDSISSALQQCRNFAPSRSYLVDRDGDCRTLAPGPGRQNSEARIRGRLTYISV